MSELVAIPFDRLPKRDYTPAAMCVDDLDEIADLLGANPKLHTMKDGSIWPARYRQLYLALGGDRFAVLTQMETRKESIEIGLEMFRQRFFDERDLLAVIESLALDQDNVHRIQNDYTWISA